MKSLIKTSIILSLFFVLTSFTWATDCAKKNDIFNQNCNELLSANDEVIVTYNNSDVCGLKYLGEVKTNEKWWFHNNDKLKAKTLIELKKQASEKGGNLVFIDIKEKKGYGLFFSTIIVGYVYIK